MSQAMTPQPIPSFEAGMRKLWTDHIVWTRQYITSAVADMPDANAAAGRLLKNQEHIGNAVAPFYGKAGGEALTKLLKQHIMIAVDLVAAAKVGDQTKFGQEDQKWTKNAEEIAVFLSSANPNWTKADLVDLLGQHLSLTKAETVARLQKKWDDDVKAFDDIFTEILTVADTLSKGIIKQFPLMFTAK
ncbi:MAG TPA: acetylglutamate kinase [Nitrososphaerales archaeon]|nr:acetylglutamate kinase [Nitrososphaerales archaeon]